MRLQNDSRLPKLLILSASSVLVSLVVSIVKRWPNTSASSSVGLQHTQTHTLFVTAEINQSVDDSWLNSCHANLIFWPQPKTDQHHHVYAAAKHNLMIFNHILTIIYIHNWQMKPFSIIHHKIFFAFTNQCIHVFQSALKEKSEHAEALTFTFSVIYCTFLTLI